MQVKAVTVRRDKPEGMPRDARAVTSETMPNALIVTITKVQAVGVRVARNYVQSFVGFLTLTVAGASGASGLVPDPMQQVLPTQLGGAILLAGQLALWPAFFSFAQNLVEILTELDQAYPRLRA